MVTGVKLSQIASGGAVNPATDVIVTVRSGTTDVLTAPGVPYTGATADVNLGTHNITANNLTATGILGVNYFSGNSYINGTLGLGYTATAGLATLSIQDYRGTGFDIKGTNGTWSVDSTGHIIAAGADLSNGILTNINTITNTLQWQGISGQYLYDNGSGFTFTGDVLSGGNLWRIFGGDGSAYFANGLAVFDNGGDLTLSGQVVTSGIVSGLYQLPSGRIIINNNGGLDYPSGGALSDINDNLYISGGSVNGLVASLTGLTVITPGGQHNYANGNPLADTSNLYHPTGQLLSTGQDLNFYTQLTANGVVISNSSGQILTPAGLKDTSNSLGATGNYLTSTGSGTAWQTGLSLARNNSLTQNKFNHFADAGNTTTTETDLYTDTLASGQLFTNGDKIIATYAGIFVSSATATRQLRAYFGGTLIFDSGALSISAGSDAWQIDVTIIRESATVVRCSVVATTAGASLNVYDNYTRITGLTLSNTQILKITGQAAGVSAATNDIVAKLGYVELKPA